jgi:hypothetical protein
VAHPSFRIISTASKSLPLKDWLADEHANMFFPIPSQPMDREEEETVLKSHGCPPSISTVLFNFAEKYRMSMSAENITKNRKLGTRSLVRIARRISKYPHSSNLYDIISRLLLAEFLPVTERMDLEDILRDCDILKGPPVVSRSLPFVSVVYLAESFEFNPSPSVEGRYLVLPGPTVPGEIGEITSIPLFDPSRDPDGAASHVPHMDHFYDNSLQTGLMRDLAIDLELLGEHVVLLGNQGVGKNKIVDRYVIIAFDDEYCV